MVKRKNELNKDIRNKWKVGDWLFKFTFHGTWLINDVYTLVQWNVIMYANLTVSFETGFKQIEACHFSPYYSNGIKMELLLNINWKKLCPNSQQMLEILTHKTLTRTNILALSGIFVLRNHNTVKDIDQIFCWSAIHVSLPLVKTQKISIIIGCIV